MPDLKGNDNSQTTAGTQGLSTACNRPQIATFTAEKFEASEPPKRGVLLVEPSCAMSKAYSAVSSLSSYRGPDSVPRFSH